MTVVDLPPDLAPAQRARVEQLLTEVPLAPHPRPRGRGDMRKPCYVCHSKDGRMGGHHLVHGDDSTVVPVHRSCHRKLHPKTKENQMGNPDAARMVEQHERDAMAAEHERQAVHAALAEEEARAAVAAARPRHTVSTRHIQRLIGNAADLARRVDGKPAGTVIGVREHQRPGGPDANVEYALCKAIADLRHAAEELDAERLSCFGWAQV